MICCGNTNLSNLSKIFCQQLIQKHVDKNINQIRATVSENLSKKSLPKIRIMMDTIKKVIKMPIEAENKFYALLLLNEIMDSQIDFVNKYFVKKLRKRMFNLAIFIIDPKDLDKKSSECLDE